MGKLVPLGRNYVRPVKAREAVVEKTKEVGIFEGIKERVKKIFVGGGEKAEVEMKPVVGKKVEGAGNLKANDKKVLENADKERILDELKSAVNSTKRVKVFAKFSLWMNMGLIR